MPLILLALLLFVVLAFAGVVLLSLVLRYRAGTSRRQARRWVATVNVWATSISAFLFLMFTFITSFWIAAALRYAFGGLGIGCLLALLSLALTRWEHDARGFFYTPSRSLALLITLAIALRLAYGWWRVLHPATAPATQHWFMTASAPQLSLSFAAALIGYYLLYAIGVRYRLARYERAREIRL